MFGARVICLVVLCTVAAPALASPRSDPTRGRSAFTGATSPSTTSVELNPAAIGVSAESLPNELYVAAHGILDRYSIQRRTLDIDNGALGAGERVTDHVLSPGGMVGGVWHTGANGRVTLGFAAQWTPDERFLEGYESLRYHTLGGYFRTYSGTIGASVRLSSRFYVGISLASQRSVLRLRFARDTALAAARDPARGIDSDCNGQPCGVENPFATERYDVDVRSDVFAAANLAANLGIVVQLARDVWLGASYHAPPGLAIQSAFEGTMEVERAPRDGGGVVTGAATVYVSQPASADLEVRARVRELDLRLGMRWEDLSRMQEYDVRGYGSFFRGAGLPEWQMRPRGFHDSFAAWAGVDQVDFDTPVIFGGRIGFETAAVDAQRTSPLTIAPASLTLDAGVQYRITPQLVLQLAYGLQYFPTVDVEDSAFDPRHQLACFDSGYDYTTAACAAVRNGYGIPTAAGVYDRLQHAARLGVRVEFP